MASSVTNRDDSLRDHAVQAPDAKHARFDVREIERERHPDQRRRQHQPTAPNIARIPINKYPAMPITATGTPRISA